MLTSGTESTPRQERQTGPLDAAIGDLQDRVGFAQVFHVLTLHFLDGGLDYPLAVLQGGVGLDVILLLTVISM